MHESSKLGYTRTFNGYKWAITHKHTKIKCGSLVVQVYTQVLIKTTSKQVTKTWSTKIINKESIWSLCKCTCLRVMIYIIVKLKWEHKKIIHINMGVSQILVMYMSSLINMAL